MIEQLPVEVTMDHLSDDLKTFINGIRELAELALSKSTDTDSNVQEVQE
jgi:hypothetical protein